jgi:hypothetical protein
VGFVKDYEVGSDLARGGIKQVAQNFRRSDNYRRLRVLSPFACQEPDIFLAEQLPEGVIFLVAQGFQWRRIPTPPPFSEEVSDCLLGNPSLAAACWCDDDGVSLKNGVQSGDLKVGWRERLRFRLAHPLKELSHPLANITTRQQPWN